MVKEKAHLESSFGAQSPLQQCNPGSETVKIWTKYKGYLSAILQAKGTGWSILL